MKPMEGTLLAALHAEPTDEAGWLVLCDWLEEEGDPRAELARLSLLLRRGSGSPQKALWQQRVQELLAAGVRPCVPVLRNSLSMELVLIPAGSFLMGSPDDEEGRSANEGVHEVELTQSFYLGVYPITQQQYEAVAGSNPSYFAASGAYKERVAGLDTSRHPVEHVTWDEATTFCRLLGEVGPEREAGRKYRLPTEAEWEYACRAGTSTPFACGRSLSSREANFDGGRPYGPGAVGSFPNRTVPVDSYAPNAFGLHDMHGNAWEWCADWFSDDYYARSPRQDPPGPARGGQRVIRGGAYNDRGASCRSAWRTGLGPDRIGSGLTFRVVLTQQ
jgi:uncharacterized protein (TIGR02996 family)